MERKSISSKEFVKGKIYTPWMLDSRQVKYEMDFGGSNVYKDNYYFYFFKQNGVYELKIPLHL